MQILYMLVLVGLGFLSFMPVVRLYQNKDYEPFKPLRELVTVVFVWTFILIFKFLIIHYSMTLAYYLHLIGYIAITATIVLFIRTVFHFMGKPFNKTLNIISAIYILLWSLIVLTNDLTNWVVLNTVSDIETLPDLLNMTLHPFFIWHAFVQYALLLIVIVILYVNLAKRNRSHLYRVSRHIFAGIVIISVILNIIHNFVYTFFLDPSYIAIVVFSYLLYTMIYKKDMGFILISESRKTLLKNMREMYFVVDDTFTIVDCSDALKERFGITEGTHADDALRELSKKTILYESIDQLSDKSYDLPYLYTIHQTFSPIHYDVKGMLYLFYDESKFVELVDKLEYLRSYDEMTGLYNRNHFERSIQTLGKNYDTFGVVVTDINGLKLFNDYFGHKAGDDLIIRFSDILKKVTKPYDDVSLIRMGGDEFAIFVGNASEKILKDIEHKLEEATFHENPLKRISISIGKALRQDSETLETTYLRADNDLYSMKKSSSNTYKELFKEAYDKQPKK